jgi:methanesulfonate monooxygenase large subunit
MMQKGYFDRKFHCFPNGHGRLDSMEIRYDAYEGVDGQRRLNWPKAPPACHKFIDLFPGITYNLRSPTFRLDSMIPLGPNKTMIEYRGLAPKGDNPEERRQRVKDYINIWGPFGRNLHEDLLAVEGQGRALAGVQSHILHAREEGLNSHDEIGMRHFYAEWSRRMGRSASDPYAEAASAGSRKIAKSAAVA